jgi:hypothetical protein
MVTIGKSELTTNLLDGLANSIYGGRTVSGGSVFLSWRQPDHSGKEIKVNLDLSVHDPAPIRLIVLEIKRVAGMISHVPSLVRTGAGATICG